MYRNSEIDKKEQLRAAVRTRDYSETAEQSFDALLTDETITETTETMPSSTTLEYTDYKGDLDIQETPSIVIKEKYTISTRGKALIALYAFLLVSIFAAIIFNATFLRGLDRNIQRTQTQNAYTYAQYVEMDADLEYKSSPEYIAEQATQMGMVK